MCGFIGFSGNLDNKEAILQKMMDRIVHRGPDMGGMYTDDGIALGFRRLSILDLSDAGAQPMANEDKSVVVVFNGEIYNFMELRRELEAKGHTFHCGADTEVLIHGYEEYGTELIYRLRGMFAFVLWDAKNKRMFGARDIFGIKPFYYYPVPDGSGLVFGSEIKAFLEHPKFVKAVNENALRPYLTLQYSATEETFFKGVYKLPAAHYFVYENGKMDVRRFWDCEFDPQPQNFEACADKLDEVVHESVAAHRIADVKVGSFLSGGVDSSVVAALVSKAIGKQLTCVFVDHGLMRKNEGDEVEQIFDGYFDSHFVRANAQERFLSKLKGVTDPEQKRKIIGAEFIRVFEEEARKLEGIEFLGQGTIYPDIIESGTKTVKVIKSHHNVGGLPEDLDFALVEPLKMLFKDEVRACGKALGLPDSMVYRQPFPGPGLGVRCLGAITRDRLEAVRESDAILREEFAANGLEGKVWQYFTVVPDIKSVGVRDGKRADEWPCILRAVNTVDAMTATVEDVPFALLQKITARITNEVKGINRVLYDLTPKPTGTIEWE